MKPRSIAQLFEAPIADAAKYERLRQLEDPRVRYVIAITPRSGSSHLCDVIKTSKYLGRPGEMLSREFIPNILKSVPARSADEYFAHVFRALQANAAGGISGIKCSWFQFREFRQAMAQPDAVDGLRYIYLTRRDLTAQAVSLYRATETKVFHTNIEHSAEALAQLDVLPYNYARIKYWREHIAQQEAGWQQYFVDKKIFPLHLHYEDIEADAAAVVHRLATYIGRPRASREVAPEESVFRKLGNRTSVEWTARFNLEYDAELRAAQAAQAAAAPPV